MAKNCAIAIDGPVASGKTVVGRLVASRLSWRFLDTGIMYRAITWVALNNNVRLDDENRLGELALKVKIEPVLDASSKEKLLLDNRNVIAYLRSQEVERFVSQVAKVPALRLALVAKQRELAQNGKIVMVGRDIGTVVLPDAMVKIFLLASVEERARRRFLEVKQKDVMTSYERILEDLQRRDKIDTERENSPLKAASDAIVVETDRVEVGNVVNKILAIVKERC